MHPRSENVAGIEDHCEAPALCALESAEGHLTRSPGASSTCDGSGTAFTSTFATLLEWGEENKLIRAPKDFDFLSRPTDGHGDEHEAWFDEQSHRWFKATYPNRFGLAWGRVGTATVHEYLRRLLLQNLYFGDDIHLVALLDCERRLRILTSQPHIAGEAAPYTETQFWLRGLGYQRIEADDRIAWYFGAENLLIADAHEGNVIRGPQGTLIPIDLNLIQPIGALLEWVNQIISN